ncbi:MAG: helicase-related protein [Gemmatimonadaceae bacterium]
MKRAPAAVVRSTMATIYLGPAAEAPALGKVSLYAHQLSAVQRCRKIMHELGGALLADDVGLGKTYVAAALLREARQPLVLAPAALRKMWHSALIACNADAQIESYEALSRGKIPRGEFDLIVLDEAHHARTPHTKRYRQIALLASRARVLLLTATPIHNSRRDLEALAALFLGRRAWKMTDAALAECVVRRERDDVKTETSMPTTGSTHWLRIAEDAAVLEALLALPPPVPPSDGGDGGTLITYSLIKQWASSRGALRGALRRRLARAQAMSEILKAGCFPTHADLAAWAFSEDAMQLALPGILVAPARDAAIAREMLQAVEAHERSLREILRSVMQDSGPDAARASHLREIRRRHPEEKVIAFTQYADTARALFRFLREDRGVAALAAEGGTVAGGRITRAEALARFAPAASGAAPPREAERIDFLLSTDLLSEGVNLQDASVVVHLDLPWTPARLEQRVGRSRRLGASHAMTSVYALAPPAASETLLAVERRLRAKLATAARSVGVAGSILPPMEGYHEVEVTSAPRLNELLRRAMGSWICADGSCGPPAPPPDTLVAAVGAPREGAIGVIPHGGRVALVAWLDGGIPTEDSAVALDVVSLACGNDATPNPVATQKALELMARWSERQNVSSIAGTNLPVVASERRRAIRKIAAIAARTPRHRQPLLAALAVRARRVVSAPYGSGAERILDDLVSSTMEDEAWLRALSAFGDIHARPTAASRPPQASAAPLAILLLQRED